MSNRKMDATFGPGDEVDWARRPIRAEKEPIDPQAALRVVGIIIVYLTFAPPIAVILWRLALSWP